MTVNRVGHIDCPGGGQVWIDGRILYVGHMRPPAGTSIWDVGDPARPQCLATIELPEGMHSHKVRVADCIMIVNHERLGQVDGTPEGGLAIWDVENPREPRLITKWVTAGRGGAPLRFRWPPRVHLSHGGGLCRQHRHDPRSWRSGPARGGRALVARGPVAGRRRGLSLVELRAAPLSPSLEDGITSQCQLLASRFLHSRHLRHDEASPRLRTQHQSVVPASHAHLSEDAHETQGVATS